MKIGLMAGLLTGVFAANAWAAPQLPPSKDEGTELSAALVTRLGLPRGCRVSLPDPKGNTARVARVESRMSAWLAGQTPEFKEPPKVYLHREGDVKVSLRGPAINPVNMGATPAMAIIQREDNLIPIGILDHSKDVHWISLSGIGELQGRIAEYKDGLPDGRMVQKMSFTVQNSRSIAATMTSGPRTDGGSYTVTALVIKLGGQLRVFGLCM